MRFFFCGFTREIYDLIQIETAERLIQNLCSELLTFHITVPQTLSTLK
jgi:hypothetical protein